MAYYIEDMWILQGDWETSYRREINKDLNAHPSSINNNRQYKNLNFYLVALNLQSICINAHRSGKHWVIEHAVIVFFCGILYIDKADIHRWVV